MAILGCLVVISKKHLAQLRHWQLKETVPTCEKCVARQSLTTHFIDQGAGDDPDALILFR